MPNFQDLQQKVFFEAKTILETLSKISSVEELLSRQDLFTEAADRIAFLKVLEKNTGHLDLSSSASADNQISNDEDFTEHALKASDVEDFLVEENAVEEVVYTNEINEIDDTPEDTQEETVIPVLSEEAEDFKDKIIDVQQELAYEAKVSEKEHAEDHTETSRRTIVEFSKEDVHHPAPEAPAASAEQQHSERKFKLAHIKGLKAMQDLFDADPLEKIQEEEKEHNVPHHESGSILKNNIPVDFMEAEKKRPEFRLDLNDKVAFTKLLFKGNDQELKSTIERLNSFDNIEEAKQYLSDLYYDKEWQKVDEYAQRLWNLVENKFL